MLNLEWLRTFKTIYEKGSLTAAAETLFISQPGASLHLSSLESYVGYKLFERRPRKLIPTERGKILYNAIADPMMQLQEVETNFQKTTREDIPTVTVGMCFETFQNSLEKYLPELDFNLIAEFGDYRELLRKLAQGVVDFVVTPQKQDERGVVYHPFSQENIVLAAGRGTDTSGFYAAMESADNQVLISWLKTQTWYGIAGDNEHLLNFWKLNFGSHPDFRPNYIVPNFHSIIRNLRVSPGLAVIPDFLCKKELDDNTIALLWRGFSPLRNTFYFASRKETLHLERIRQIEAYLEQEMPALEP
ncbi:LysR family transcriptional regulator [Desulfosediminicola sp.]|uniref:LysR family transcriptional regulator n=1 Tax=Desulfosediminicola sp. TaxID=2886825 RepID=UPI003AF30A60